MARPPMIPPPGYVESLDADRVYELRQVARETGIPRMVLLNRLRSRERQSTQMPARSRMNDSRSTQDPVFSKHLESPPRLYTGEQIADLLRPRKSSWPRTINADSSGLVPRAKR